MTQRERGVFRAAAIAWCGGVLLGAGSLGWQHWAWPRLYEEAQRRAPELNIAMYFRPQDKETAGRLLALALGWPLLIYAVLALLSLGLVAISFMIGGRAPAILLPGAVVLFVIIVMGIHRCWEILPSFID
jgi:hypothetical protein